MLDSREGKLKFECGDFRLHQISSCSFGAKHLTPRTLSARFLGNLVCVEGIVTKCK